jgi:hypothetical protein
VDFGDFLWSLLIIYFFFFYFLVLFRILADLFTDPEVSAVGKTGWVIFLLFFPIIAMIVYLIARGQRMSERAIARAKAQNEEQQEYIRQVAGSSKPDPAAQIAKGHELLNSGAITPQEFDALKVKALA